MSEGKKRRGNLLLLCKYAEQYAETGNDSIGGFVKHILKLSDEGLAAAASESGDMVKIMSIHASKGLQFPICIVADTATRFGEHEKRGSTVYSADMGIGFKYYNSDIMEKETTLGREIVLDKLHNDRICEELRLLYVAMTRTKDRLVITSALSNRDKKVSDLRNLLIANRSEISNGVLRRTSSYSDWLLLSLMLHPCGKALRGNDAPIIAEEAKSAVEVVFATATEDTSGAVAETVKGEPNAALSRQLKENILGSYPYEAVSRVEAKASVSVIANKAESRKFRFSGKPSFMSKGGITATEKGTATHRVMELFDFTKANDIDGELERLYRYQYLSEREYKAIEREKLKAFFSSDIFARIMNAEDYKRELRFLTEMPASRVAPELKGEDAKENILVQGAVDLCIVESDGIVILDFKTDRAENPEDLKTAYGEQLNIYGMACEKIFEKPVKEKIIYSFALSKAIKL
jgi:ATP-dependent helicase/nuclease subunit A